LPPENVLPTQLIELAVGVPLGACTLVCEHLKFGWSSPVKWTYVRPSSPRKQVGGSDDEKRLSNPPLEADPPLEAPLEVPLGTFGSWQSIVPVEQY
jgi:hypothetical protein